MVLYCRSVHFGGFEHAKDSQAFYEMSSLKESKAFSLADTSGESPPSMFCCSQTPSLSCSSQTPSMSYHLEPFISSSTSSLSWSSALSPRCVFINSVLLHRPRLSPSQHGQADQDIPGRL